MQAPEQEYVQQADTAAADGIPAVEAEAVYYSAAESAVVALVYHLSVKQP